MGKRPRGTGSIFTVPGSRFLWVGYIDSKGDYQRESSKTERRREAQKFLAERMRAVGTGNFLGPRVEKILVDELFNDLVKDYRIHGQFFQWPQRCWDTHLKDHFGGMKAAYVGTGQIVSYVEKRQRRGS
jgi:hypothetical protein